MINIYCACSQSSSLPVNFHLRNNRGMTTDYSPEKGDGSGSNGSDIEAKLPKFFKIVSNQGVHRLRLPPEFTRRYGHNLTDSLSLKVPNGLVWKVELVQYSNGEAWLHRGWQRFQEYYSIQLGHLLLFKYVGNSHFEAHIFDTTATEIEYSYYDSLERDALMNQVAKTESESDDSVVFLKEILAGKNVGRKHQDVDDDNNPPPTWGKKRRMQEYDGLHSEKLRRSSRVEQNSSSHVKKESSFPDSSPNYQSYIDEHGEGTKLKYPDRKQVQQRAVDGNERFKAYTRALVFMSEKPTRNLFFVVVMHPSYVSTRRSALHIPPVFAKEISLGNGNSSILLVYEGKTWLVRCVRGKQGATLTTGWRKFTEDNDLKVGDACVFEASKRINLAWDIIIFRG